MTYFDDVTLVDYFENSFKLKVNKNINNKTNPTNGFLFTYLEDVKRDCNISEYSISQTSLEQIFNKFAKEVGEEVIDRSNKKELKLSKELIKSYE